MSLDKNKKPTVKLDVGGSHLIKAHQEVLCKVPGSRLEQQFANCDDLSVTSEGNIFIDRDGATFLALVNYLRNNRDTFPKFESENEKEMFG